MIYKAPTSIKNQYISTIKKKQVNVLQEITKI